jgi:hypothetical protein
MKTGTLVAVIAIPVVAVGAFFLLRKKPAAGMPVNGIAGTPSNYQPGTGLGKQPTPPPAKPPPAQPQADVGAQLAVAGIQAAPGLITAIGGLFGGGGDIGS